MNPKIRALANLIRAKKEQTGKKCVLMLGAGASLSSGVKPTKDIMEGLLAQYGIDLTEGTLRDRFDRLWARADADTRDLFLRSYLELRPSIGYMHLAKLIHEGYFDLVITFNFDQLLEAALREVGSTDSLPIVRGEYHEDALVRKAVESTRPRVKILKMHGGLKGGDSFLFTRGEMHNYPEGIKALIRELTRQDVLVCGYAFEDLCVVRAFSEDGGTIYCVNPSGAPPNLVPFLSKRRSEDWVIRGKPGYFDEFFSELHQELTTGSAQEEKPRVNPFKFLLSYETRDKDWFCGRRRLTRTVLEMFSAGPPRVVHLMGPPKAGKTSFVRAGVIANLDPDRSWPVYLRCQGPLDTWFAAAIGRVLPPADEHEDPKAATRRLAASTPKHVVVVLDQFERVVNRYPETERGQRQLRECLNGLWDYAGGNLTFVCVGEEDWGYLKGIMAARNDHPDDHVDFEIPRLKPKMVRWVIGTLARKAGIQFDPEAIRAIVQKYESAPTGFSLGHVQAICNILAESAHVDLNRVEKALDDNGEALDVALNLCDIVSFVEDIPDEVGRTLFRKVMKVIPVESKKVLATYLKDHFSDLFTPPEYHETSIATKR